MTLISIEGLMTWVTGSYLIVRHAFTSHFRTIHMNLSTSRSCMFAKMLQGRYPGKGSHIGLLFPDCLLTADSSVSYRKIILWLSCASKISRYIASYQSNCRPLIQSRTSLSQYSRFLAQQSAPSRANVPTLYRTSLIYSQHPSNVHGVCLYALNTNHKLPWRNSHGWQSCRIVSPRYTAIPCSTSVILRVFCQLLYLKRPTEVENLRGIGSRV